MKPLMTLVALTALSGCVSSMESVTSSYGPRVSYYDVDSVRVIHKLTPDSQRSNSAAAMKAADVCASRNRSAVLSSYRKLNAFEAEYSFSCL